MPGVLFSVFLCVLACCFVGLRLLSLARRTRKLPELCMALGLLAFALAQVSRLALGALQVAARKDCGVVDHTHVIEARRALWP